MSDHDKLAYAFVCLLLLAIFLEALGLVIVVWVFKGKIPEDPLAECPKLEPFADGRDDCPVCRGDISVCAEISKASITKQRKDVTPGPVQHATAEVCYSPRNLQIGP